MGKIYAIFIEIYMKVYPFPAFKRKITLVNEF